MSTHLVNQIRNSSLSGDNTLHVVGVIQNAVRYQSRYRLFRDWVKEMLQTPNVKLYVVEATFGDRAPECAPEHGEYEYLEVKTKSEIWLKENLINLGVSRLFPNNWKYMCWCDCDVSFRDHNWAQESLHQMQHYNVIQPWSQASDLDYHGGVHDLHQSFGSLCAKGKPMWHGKGKIGYQYGHTGFAVCCTRYFYENVNRLIDFCIVGAGDHHMLWACLGKIDSTIHQGVCKDYFLACDLWQKKALRASSGIVGFVNGRIEHQWHGAKVNRQYWGRWDILIRNNYDPLTDICYDSQGIVTLCGNNQTQLEHELMIYNRQRQEDAL